jgi:3-oxoacyl-[acyl-carrier protein] reductase
VDLGLEGRVALVTGASSGIGRGIAAALVGEGVKVAVASRTRERIEAAATEIGAAAYVHDLGDLEAAPELVERVESDLGPLDILVPNTGGPPFGDPLGFSVEQWESAHREIVLGPMALIQAAVPGMRERGFGRIVNVASTSIREPIPNLMLSNVERSGIVAGFKTLARQLAGDGITLNTVLPGWIDTDRLASLLGSRETAHEIAADQVPAGRLGSVEEIAAVATFLCSVPAAYVTGEAVRVDGARTAAV